MTVETINLGAAPDDGSGDSLREAGGKINNNFDSLDVRLNNAESSLGSVGNLSTRVSQVEISLGGVSSSLVNLDNDLTSLEGRMLAEETKGSLPPGGTAGQLLTKVSSDPNDASWQDPPESLDGRPDTLRTNVLTNRKFGRYKNYVPAGDFTCQVIMELETEFYAVRIGIPNMTTASIPNVKVTVSSGSDWLGPQYQTHPNLPDANWIANPRTVTLEPRISTDVASITYTDLIVLKSVARVNGTRPMIAIRIEFPSGGPGVAVPYQDLYGWRAMSITEPGARPMRASSQAVLGVTNSAAYTTTSSVDTNVCVPVVEYSTVKSGKQLMFVGDSTVEGSGGNTRAWGSFQRAAALMSTAADPIDYYNCGMHGLGSATYSQAIGAFAPQVLPTHIFYYPLTVNDIPVTGGINDSTYTQVYQGIASALARAKEQKVIPQVITFGALPYNAAFKDSGTNDFKRRDLNVWFSTFTGVEFIEGYAEAIAGPLVNGQTTIASGMTNDNVHPNDAGYDALVDVVLPFMQATL